MLQPSTPTYPHVSTERSWSHGKSLAFDTRGTTEYKQTLFYDTGSSGFTYLYTNALIYLDHQQLLAGSRLQWKMLRWYKVADVLDHANNLSGSIMSNWVGPNAMSYFTGYNQDTQYVYWFSDPGRMMLPDRGAWYRYETWLNMNSAPGTADGTFRVKVTDPIAGSVVADNVISGVMFNAVGDVGNFRYLVLQNYFGNASDGGYAQPDNGQAVAWWDDIFIAQSQARVEIGDAPTWAACANREIQPASAWADGSLSITLNAGARSSFANTYLYVVDAHGVVNTNGYPVPTGAPPVNHAPVATAQSVSTAENTAQTITLAATDADGDALSYAIVANPGHGVLSGSGAIRTYTPDTNYNGSDSFTFKANDGTVDSNTATVSITVTAPPANQAPVVNAAAASPATVVATSTALTATASDADNAESTLTYTWTAAGPAAVTFTPNATNAAKATTATFTRSGSYTLTVTARDPAGATGTRQVTASVSQTATALSISPASASLQPSQTVDFHATVTDQFDIALASQPALTWTLSGSGGTIDANGRFTAGVAAATCTVTADAGGPAGTALVTVSAASTAGSGSAAGSSGGGCGAGGAVGLLIGLSVMLRLRSRRR